MKNTPTPYTDEWRADLELALADRGRRSELARHLTAHSGTFSARKVQVAKVLNQNVTPDAEFVLAVNAWLKKHPK